MALIYTTNQENTAFDIMRALKDTLVLAGWVVKDSGKGTGKGYGALADTWDVPYFAAGGTTAQYGNYAWVRIQHPIEHHAGCYREMVWQCYTTSQRYSWKLTYSYDGFKTGTPDEDTAPTSADTKYLWGTISNCTYFFENATATNTYHIITEDVSPYRFYFWSSTKGRSYAYTSMFWDTVKTGTYPAADIDPFIYNAYYSTTKGRVYGSYLLITSGHNFCWIGKDGAATGDWAQAQVLGYRGDGTIWPATIRSPGANPLTNDVDMLPVMWLTEGNEVVSGWKGYSDFFQAVLYNLGPGNTLDVAGSKDYAIWGEGALAVPWNGTDMNI